VSAYVRNNFGFVLFVSVLGLSSLFFTVQVEATRRDGAKARLHAEIPSGTVVRVEDTLDGDELLVRPPGGEVFVVRLTGVKTFDPKSQDPDVGGYGRNALDYLGRQLVGQLITLEFAEFELDRSGRLLAYARLGEEDVGAALLAQGLALPFLKYPSEREATYRQAQERARSQRAGLWANGRATERALALLAAWEASRDD
jgi:endonuclease YncB( thermonuclease family)